VFRAATDHVVPVSSTQTIRRLVSSEELTEVVLERSYHVATMDHDAAQVFAGSLEFVDRVSRG